ncbi:MAG: MBL fold metallo-hydrolase [Bacteriovoracaceae bacterium]
MKLHFWGATDDVTGSMTFIELNEGFILIDCGLTQGSEETLKLNDLPLPIRPQDIKAVLITHAHLDHSGYLPRLVKNGFTGSIYCTAATAKLIRIILLDSAKIGEKDFYDEEDVQRTLHLIKTHEWNEHFDLLGASVSFFSSGHILGASSISLKFSGKKIIFSGDLGRYDDPILPPHEACPTADVIIMESTYGGKIRKANIEKDLHQFLITVSRESRVGIIASFAVARAQTLLTLIHEFYQRHPEEKVRVVIDSPMMKEANKIYLHYSQYTKKDKDLLTALEHVESIDHEREWESLKKKSGPLIILSSSGMLSGGRIGRSLYNWHEDKKAILFLPGYQGEGTPGREFIRGKRTLMTSEGELFTWQGEVWSSEAFSSHGDQQDLLKWVSTNNSHSQIYLIHGETTSKISFQKVLQEKGAKVEIPTRGSIYNA